MENGNPIEQIKGFAEKKLHALRENPDESGTRAYLAKMRKGVGKVPGADPELWGILFEDLPEELTGRGNTPGRAELALYAALTLYAIPAKSLFKRRKCTSARNRLWTGSRRNGSKRTRFVKSSTQKI